MDKMDFPALFTQVELSVMSGCGYTFDDSNRINILDCLPREGDTLTVSQAKTKSANTEQIQNNSLKYAGEFYTIFILLYFFVNLFKKFISKNSPVLCR